jgi:hypothetical protein
MGTNMAPYDTPFGFIPYGPTLRVNRYAVYTLPTENFSPGDIVSAGGAVVSTPKGYLMAVEDGSTVDGDPNLLGAVVSVEDEDGLPLAYMAPARVGNGTIAGYLMIADHPDQLFIAQEEGTTVIAITSGGLNTDIVSTALQAPNTDTGRSTMEIDSSEVATTATLQIKLLRPHEDDIPGVEGEHCRWICTINEHHYGDNYAGL